MTAHLPKKSLQLSFIVCRPELCERLLPLRITLPERVAEDVKCLWKAGIRGVTYT